ncbi:unnamed protein product [Phytophthora lilii]|uniref:Unnamed protein product n=1 Tax=Phytophthora lilii TaxID=2077276 RepID=A0A9W6U7W0_9STRA|nr:unnamed protein product [Phytophthora lilii]
MGLRAVGNKQDKFLPRVSKMLSFDVDPTTASISTAEVCFELKSPDPNPRASSYFTYYDRTTIKNHSSGLDQLSKTPVLGLEDMSSDLEKKSSFQTANAIGEGVGALVSVGSWNSKQIHLSLAVNSAHSNSYKTSWSLSRSRHSSTSSLSRVSDILEEKMVISSNKINRIVAI